MGEKGKIEVQELLGKLRALGIKKGYRGKSGSYWGNKGPLGVKIQQRIRGLWG